MAVTPGCGAETHPNADSRAEASASPEFAGNEEPAFDGDPGRPAAGDPTPPAGEGGSTEPSVEPSTPGTGGSAESCETAAGLLSASTPAATPEWDYTLQHAFGETDDYNPLNTSGLPPACSMVYDAKGAEVVFELALEPGQTLHARYTVSPGATPGGIYMLDSCPDATWPDHDASGACGSNEYASAGFCAIGDCDPLTWSFTHPTTLDGEPTTTATYWLVLDTVGDTPADSFTLDWSIVTP